MDETALDWLTEQALAALARGESITPAATTLLLRRYVTTGRNDFSAALGAALSCALEESSSEREAIRRSEWLALFTEAAAIPEDDLRPTVVTLVTALRSGWPCRGDVKAAMQSVDACLAAAGVGNGDDLVPAAIEELERIVGVAYEPGGGIEGALGQRSGEPGTLGDHVATASALLTAYAVSERLPYSMLAEEVMQFARRSWWDDARGGFRERTSNAERHMSHGAERTAHEGFIANCEAARVLCRLAALHGDADYRQAAVIAQQSDYAHDATRTLESLVDEYRTIGLDAAVYGLALGEYFDLKANLK